MPRVNRLLNSQTAHAAELHAAAFPKFFLTFLGPRFLRLLYKGFLSDDSGICLGAMSDSGDLIGVVAGTTMPKGFFKRLLRRQGVGFALASCSALVKKPWIAPRLFRALTYRGGGDYTANSALLSSIAVSPSAQGTGVGRLLVAKFLDEAKLNGAHSAYLTTDAKNNDAVNEFYTRLGWSLEKTFNTPEGRVMNVYSIAIADGVESNRDR